jgi:selenide,water dikinase
MALNISGFPTTLPLDIISEIMRGGADKVLEAGGILAGGHTVDDEEPKYGLAVIGFVHPDKVLTRKGAKAGDVLALTKPLGVGLITTVLKSGLAKSEHIEAATQSMLRLNKKAAELINGMGINACTDITGFALLGHATDMALQSDALLRFHLKQIPLLPGAEEYADQWLFPGGTCRNEDAFKEHVKFGAGVLAEYQQLLYTPETSGGLLISVPKENIDELIMLFSEAGEDFRVVGEVAEGSGVEVTR